MQAQKSALALYVEELMHRVDRELKQLEIPHVSDGLTEEDLVEAFIRGNNRRRQVVLDITSRRHNCEAIVRMIINRVFAEMLERKQRRCVRLDELRSFVRKLESVSLTQFINAFPVLLKAELREKK